MAVSANQIIKRADGCRISYPVQASAHLYEGTFVFTDAYGYADDDIDSDANKFGGIAIQEADNSSGADGAIEVECWRTGIFEWTHSGLTQADINKKVYASDNNTITLTSSSNVLIGEIVRYVSSTKVLIAIDVDGE